MRAKSVFRYSEPSVVGGFIAVEVDEEMLDEIMRNVEEKIANAAYDMKLDMTKELIKDYESLEVLKKALVKERTNDSNRTD